jgi:DNA-binding MarR family transcriptional regulator
VDALDLILLGRRLMKLGEVAMRGSAAGTMPTGTRLVMGDVFAHPESAIKDITNRTGLQQSHVSVAVAELRERGILETAADPADRRRTIVRVSDEHPRRVLAAGTVPVDQVVAGALRDDDPQAVAEFVARLDEIATRLQPEDGRIARELAAARAGRRGAP